MPLTAWQTHAFCVFTLHFARQALQSKDLVWLLKKGLFVNYKTMKKQVKTTKGKEWVCCLF